MMNITGTLTPNAPNHKVVVRSKIRRSLPGTQLDRGTHGPRGTRLAANLGHEVPLEVARQDHRRYLAAGGGRVRSRRGGSGNLGRAVLRGDAGLQVPARRPYPLRR